MHGPDDPGNWTGGKTGAGRICPLPISFKPASFGSGFRSSRSTFTCAMRERAGLPFLNTS